MQNLLPQSVSACSSCYLQLKPFDLRNCDVAQQTLLLLFIYELGRSFELENLAALSSELQQSAYC